MYKKKNHKIPDYEKTRSGLIVCVNYMAYFLLDLPFPIEDNHLHRVHCSFDITARVSRPKKS